MKRRSFGKLFFGIICGLILVFLIAPAVVVIPMSFSSAPYLTFPPPGLSLRWYQAYFSSTEWMRATLTSFKVAVLSTLLSVALGTLGALGLVRSQFRGKRLVYILILMPMVVPVIIVSISMYSLYVTFGLVGTTLGMILAHTLLAVPYVVVNVSAVLAGFDRRLEHAAMSLGANRWTSLIKVTIPLIKPGIFSGALFAFITSFDELVVTMFICGISNTTLPKKMFDGIRFEVSPTISAVSTMLISFAAVLLYMNSRRKADEGPH